MRNYQIDSLMNMGHTDKKHQTQTSAYIWGCVILGMFFWSHHSSITNGPFVIELFVIEQEKKSLDRCKFVTGFIFFRP